MKTSLNRIATFILVSLFAVPAAVLAADKAAKPDPHHPNEAQSAEATDKATQAAAGQIRERMHARMLAMRNISAPQARQKMMMAQMQDMTEMMAMMGSACPMMQDMMGGQDGMMSGPMMGKPSK